MRLSSTRSFWMALISMFIMLSSSFASSAPLMTLQMMAGIHHTHMSADCAMVNSSAQSHNMAMSHTPLEEGNGAYMSDSASHQTCSANACVSIFAYLPPTSNGLSAQFQLALIPIESAKSTLHRQQSLYRPPIA